MHVGLVPQASTYTNSIFLIKKTAITEALKPIDTLKDKTTHWG